MKIPEWCQSSVFNEDENERCYCMKPINHEGMHKCCCDNKWKGDVD